MLTEASHSSVGAHLPLSLVKTNKHTHTLFPQPCRTSERLMMSRSWMAKKW